MNADSSLPQNDSASQPLNFSRRQNPFTIDIENSSPGASSPSKNPSKDPYVNLDSSIEDEARNARRFQSGTFKTQLKALFQKNVALQSKQIGTNICQVKNLVIKTN